jgi:hypothetical protein
LFTNFKNANQLYLDVVAPLACTIKCFESNSLNFGDIFTFWVGIAATLRDLLARPKETTGISQGLAGEITMIVNRHYKEFINHSPTDIYFTAFFLDPSMYAHWDGYLD